MYGAGTSRHTYLLKCCVRDVCDNLLVCEVSHFLAQCRTHTITDADRSGSYLRRTRRELVPFSVRSKVEHPKVNSENGRAPNLIKIIIINYGIIETYVANNLLLCTRYRTRYAESYMF